MQLGYLDNPADFGSPLQYRYIWIILHHLHIETCLWLSAGLFINIRSKKGLQMDPCGIPLLLYWLKILWLFFIKSSFYYGLSVLPRSLTPANKAYYFSTFQYAVFCAYVIWSCVRLIVWQQAQLWGHSYWWWKSWWHIGCCQATASNLRQRQDCEC